jgi:hypothetical protein
MGTTIIPTVDNLKLITIDVAKTAIVSKKTDANSIQ